MEITGCFLLLVITFFYTNQVEAQGRGSVRLFNNGNTSPSNTAGIVEVYYNDQWGTICRSSYNDDTATVVCHQLGYSGGSESSDNYGSITSRPAIDSVACSINNLVILQCSYNHVNPTCSGTDFLAVQCYTTPIWNNPYSGMLRLQDGPYAGMGRVEVYCNGHWGAICDDNGFNDNAANTVCTQLGYTNILSTSATAYSGTIWLSEISCDNNYSCLRDCVGGSCPASSTTCNDNVANVTCSYIGDNGVGGSTQYTCGISSALAAAIIAGIVIACIALIVCCVLIITIPICICCCLGVGIGAAASSGGKRYTYSNI